MDNGKSNIWIWIILLIVIAGAAVWYFYFRTPTTAITYCPDGITPLPANGVCAGNSNIPPAVVGATCPDGSKVPSSGVCQCQAGQPNAYAMPPNGCFVILSAIFGVQGNAKQTNDVTKILNSNISNNSLNITATGTPEYMDSLFGDPAYGFVKTLVVSYRIGTGSIQYKTFNEGDNIVLP